MERCQSNTMDDNMQLQEALVGIRKAVQGEREDEMFYDYLMSQAPTREEREIIGSIRDDEKRHNKIFRRIYEDFTGKRVPEGEEEDIEAPDSYLDGIKKALFGELRAVEKYRAIRRRLPEGPLKDVLFDIITDEIKHASKYNYLFTLNHCTMCNGSDGDMKNSTTCGMRRDITTTPTSNTTNTTGTTNTGTTSTATPLSSTSGSGATPLGNMMGTTLANALSKIASLTNANQNANTTTTANFTPDDWVRYIVPLVTRALAESKQGINPEHLYQEFILAGVLVGLGKDPREAIEQVEEWENTGTSKLLAMSKMSRYFNSED